MTGALKNEVHECAQKGTGERDGKNAHPKMRYGHQFASFHARLCARNDLLKDYSVQPECHSPWWANSAMSNAPVITIAASKLTP
jgi:hypothetical protein